MRKNDNDQVGYVDQSFILGEDFEVGAPRTGEAAGDLTGNMRYWYRLSCAEI